MPKIEVYDPPMCCSSGVCGPEPDEQLARFSADLDWLGRNGARVRRFNLAHDPLAFTQHPQLRQLLQQSAGEVLPVIVVDDVVVSQGQYPSREQLARWAGIAPDDAPGTASAAAATTPGLAVLGGDGCCSGGDCC